MVRYRPGLETRRRILAATREVLGEHGLDGTTLKAICDRAEVGAGSFYNLFDSKEEAILQVVREAIRAVDPAPGGGGGESLDDLVDAFITFVTADPELARIYFQIAVGGGLTDGALRTRVLRHHERRVERFAGAVLRSGQCEDTSEARARAHRVLAALTGLALYWLLDPSQAFDELARGVVRADVTRT